MYYNKIVNIVDYYITGEYNQYYKIEIFENKLGVISVEQTKTNHEKKEQFEKIEWIEEDNSILEMINDYYFRAR